jgi:hypothetical protein
MSTNERDRNRYRAGDDTAPVNGRPVETPHPLPVRRLPVEAGFGAVRLGPVLSRRRCSRSGQRRPASGHVDRRHHPE